MGNKVKVWTKQHAGILTALEEGGRYVVKKEYIQQKMGENSRIYFEVYNWYRNAAEKIVPAPDDRPPDAESAVWCYRNPKYIEKHDEYKILKLNVPAEKAVFFRMSDWNKRLNLRYIGNTSQEEDSYNQKISKYGVDYEGSVYLTSFYPQLKNELIKSWQNLFRYDKLVKEQGDLLFDDMQAGVWHLELEWVQEII